MWEIAKFTSHKQVFMRRTISFVIATLLAIIFVSIFNTQSASAADASWVNSNSIVYNDNTYNGPAPESTNKELEIGETSQTYVYVEPITTDNNQVTIEDRKIHIIYFEAGVDITTSTSAKYRNYTYFSATDFANPSPESNISIDTAQATASPQTSSCNVSHGIGWLLCPVMNWVSEGMDFAYKALSDFLFVRPSSNNPDSALFRGWSYMRNIANIAFVIVFLIVIYSQLTNAGVNNYGLKKLLHRLIIAAILVNLSYYVCAIAVDVSNILGYSIQDLFLIIRDGLVGVNGGGWETMSWSSITGYVLSGGTAVVAGTIGIVSLFPYGISGSIFLLLPSLVSGLMAVLVALVIIAARQAMITILIIISPLAFVAYLMPNTEKLFEKWKSTFLTLLVLFPAFSIVFGGSQLAGAAIIQNANSSNTVILGMLIQVAPLFITPMLIKLSGSTLAGLANIVNNPNKGLIDRTRKFAEDRSENIRAKRLAEDLKPIKNPNSRLGKIRRYSIGKRAAQTMDHNRRRREYDRAADNATTDAKWYNSSDYRNIDQRMRKATESKAIGELRSEGRYLSSATHARLNTKAYNFNTAKQLAEQTVERDLNALIQTDSTMIVREAQLRTTIRQNEQQKLNLDNVFKDLEGGVDTSQGQHLARFVTINADITRDVAIAGLVTKSAQRMQGKIVYEALKDTQTVAGFDAQGQPLTFADIAGGIDPLGASRARAAAESESAKALSENAAAAGILLENSNLSDDEWFEVASGTLPGPGNARSTIEQQIAAVQKIVQVGYEPHIARLIEKVSQRNIDAQNGADDQEEVMKLQKALGATLAPSSKKPQYFPGPKLGELSRGAMTDTARDLVASTLIDEDLSMESFGNMSLKEMERINNTLTDGRPITKVDHRGAVMDFEDESRWALYDKIDETLKSDIAKNKLTSKQVAELKDMMANLTRGLPPRNP